MLIFEYGIWTGPQEDDCVSGSFDHLIKPVDGSRWPYGPPTHHEQYCTLQTGGLFCDCAASCADDDMWGIGS